MNRSRLLMIGVVALALGAFVSMLVYRNLQAKTPAVPVGQEVVVASSDLEVGTKIGDNDVKLVRLPAEDLPPGFYQKKSQVIGHGVILPIQKGEFVLPNKLAGQNVYGLPALIPPGMRAVSVRVNDTTSVSGFVLPGSRVDVLLTGNPEGSNQQQTTTVLENVSVIATGQKLERNAAGEAQSAPVVTLLVSPDDAQKLTLAMTQGHIQLALRNPLDTRQEELAAVKTDALYKNVSAPRAEPVYTRPKRAPVVAPPAAAPAPYTIEIYKGDKKEEDKF